MATKKFKCKVCGYIHEGDAAPEKCPVCQAPASEFEEIVEAGGTEKPAKKGLNTDGNTYHYIFMYCGRYRSFLVGFRFQGFGTAVDG